MVPRAPATSLDLPEHDPKERSSERSLLEKVDGRLPRWGKLTELIELNALNNSGGETSYVAAMDGLDPACITLMLWVGASIWEDIALQETQHARTARISVASACCKYLALSEWGLTSQTEVIAIGWQMRVWRVEKLR